MIICFVKKCKSFCEKILKKFNTYEKRDKYIKSLIPTLNDIKNPVCPYCKAKNKFVKYGKYSRNISILINNQIENHVVLIQRVICKSCKSTHALLPSFVIPYKIMAIYSIAKIVQDSCISSAYKVAEVIDLSYQAIYGYISLVLAFFTDFKILNNNKEYINPKNFNQKYFFDNCIYFSNSDFRLDFFEMYNWFLFMSKFRNNPSPPISFLVQK